MPSAFHPHTGGVEELTLRLAQQLSTRESAPLILTNRWPRSLPAVETVDGVEVVRHPMRPGPGQGLKGRATVAEARAREVLLLRHLKQRQVSLVHVQCVSNQAYLARRISRELDTPLVVTLQGELTMDATGIYRTPAMMSAWHGLLDEADAVSGCSQYVVDEARAAHPSLRADAVAIANGVHSAGRVEPKEGQPPYVFAVGRHVPQKGFDVLLEALARMARPLRLVLGGDGEMRPQLEALTRELGLKDRVRFTGALPHSEVLSWCAGAAAFVLPSRHEPQGIVVLEAMSVGTLVLAADVGGVSEMVRDGGNGFLFPGGDAQALAALLDAHVGGAHDAVVDAARQTAQAHSWAAVTDRYASLYESARAQHRRRQAR